MKDEPPHADKKRRDSEKGAEETKHSRVGIKGFYLTKRRTASAGTFARDADDRSMRPTTADTLVAHEERDIPCPDDEKAGVTAESVRAIGGDTADTTTSGPALETHKISSSSLSRQNQKALSRKISQTPETIVNLNLDTDYPVHPYDDYNPDNGNNNADDEILEVPRGREGRLWISANGSSPVSSPVSGTGRGQSSTPPRTISPRSSILSPISPALNIPLPHSPNNSQQPGSRPRPRTAPTVSTATVTISPSPLASAPSSRPGTGDSSGPIRHHRLDSIRDPTSTVPPHGHHRTPTRDSSPSRSVRFVDYVDGERGHVGPFGPVGGSSGNANDNEGRIVTVVDIPPPLPSRSSSFNKIGNGGRNLAGGLEGEEPSVSASSGSVVTMSRPPTR